MICNVVVAHQHSDSPSRVRLCGVRLNQGTKMHNYLNTGEFGQLFYLIAIGDGSVNIKNLLLLRVQLVYNFG